MHVAIIYDCLFPWSTGGGERLYRGLAEAFVARGHSVTYLTRTQWPADDPPRIAGVRVVAVSGRYGLYDEQGRRRLPAALRFALDVLRHLARHRRSYDAVLVSALPVLNVLAVRAALVGRRRPVVVADWLEVWRSDQWREYSGALVGTVAAVLQRIGVRLSPRASCHAQGVADRLRTQGLRSAPVLSPGLIAGGPAPVPNRQPPLVPRVVFVGRHIPDKQVELVPRAVAQARRQLPELRATILGDGQQRPAVLAEVRRLGLEDVVDLPGFVSQDELDAAVREASCLVNPSVREGYGLVVVEACSVGTPVVLVRAEDNAAVELVEEGVNGFIAPSAAAVDLGRALVRAVLGGSELRSSTIAWFERAARERTVEATADQLLSVLASGGSPAQVRLRQRDHR